MDLPIPVLGTRWEKYNIYLVLSYVVAHVSEAFWRLFGMHASRMREPLQMAFETPIKNAGVKLQGCSNNFATMT